MGGSSGKSRESIYWWRQLQVFNLLKNVCARRDGEITAGIVTCKVKHSQTEINTLVFPTSSNGSCDSRCNIRIHRTNS